MSKKFSCLPVQVDKKQISDSLYDTCLEAIAMATYKIYQLAK